MRCRLCKRPLTSPASILAGIGPTCSGEKGKGNRIRAKKGKVKVAKVVEDDGQLELFGETGFQILLAAR